MGGRLLLADDSITIQKVVELTFAETEHTVVAVGSGRDLLARVSEVGPDVVLCDVVMPDMNGYDVCQTLKSDPNTLHIPVILLTGTFEPFDRDRALAAGCDAIVTKPFEARELIATVEDLLRRSEAVRGAAPQGAEEAPLAELGIEHGVPSLDFTTTGFDKMVPPAPQPELPPDHGIELTSSSLGRSFDAPAPPAPPELAEAKAPIEEEAFVFGDEAPSTEPEAPAALEVGAAPVGELAEVVEAPLLAEEETFPSARPEVPVGPAAEIGAPVFHQDVAAAEPYAASEPLPDVSATSKIDIMAFRNDAPEAFAPPIPVAPENVSPFAGPEPEPAPEQRPVAPPPTREEPAASPAPSFAEVAPPAPAQAVELGDAEIERIAQRVLALLPTPEPVPVAAAAPAAGPELTDDQIRLIAGKVLELAQPMLEQIAWEVIPDMAELIVRNRIRELETAAEAEN